MEFRISDTFVDSLGELSNQDQMPQDASPRAARTLTMIPASFKPLCMMPCCGREAASRR